MGTRWIIVTTCVGSAVLAVAGGCATPGAGAASSRLTASDIVETADTLRASLAASPWLAGRTPDSPKFRLGLSPAENRSNDRLAESDRWALTSLVVNDPSAQQLLAERNVDLYLPEETEATLERLGVAPDRRVPGANEADREQAIRPEFRVSRSLPTHVLRAEIRSIARQGSSDARSPSDERLDVYFIDYRVTRIDTGNIDWSQSARLARRARGTAAD